MNGSSIQPHPEAQELLRQREVLREALAAVVEEWHGLHHQEKQNLLALYQQKIGVWELKRLEKQVLALRLKRKMELIQAALNSGCKPDLNLVELQLAEEFQLWQTKVREAAKALQSAETHLKNLLSPKSNRELQKFTAHW